MPYVRLIIYDNHYNVIQLIELRRYPKGDEKRMRATLRKATKKVTTDSDLQQKIRHLGEDNYRYRQMLESVSIVLYVE